MGQTVKLRRSAVSGKKPTNDQLELGELSVNTTDGKIFLSKSGSNGPSVEEIVTTNSDITGSINISGDITGSIFTGSFKGDGSELYNIPSDAIIGLTLNQISSGSSTATIDEDSLQINVDTVITGSLTATEITGSGLGLTDVPVYISGSGADNLPYDGTYTKLHFDESTGIKVETNNTTGVAKIFLSGVAAEGAGDGRTAKLSVATPSTTWTFNHGLGEKYPSITVFGSNDEVIIPQTIDVVSDSQLVVTFSTPQSGVVTATVGGGLPSSNNDEGKVLSINGDGLPTWKGGILSSSITFDTYTSSVDDKITSLETESGSIRGDFNTYTSSNDDRLDDIEVSTGSLNSFTSSINTTIKTKLNNDNVVSGSVQVDIEDTTNYNLVDGRITDLESFSSSIDTIFATDNDVTTLRSDFNTITSSFDGRLDSLESESGSIRSDFNTITSSFDGRLDSIETSTSSLNSFTSSINTTIKTKLNNDNVVSGSVQINIEDTTNYNLVSGRLDDIETSTGSLNSFTSSINTTIKNKLNNDNVVSGSVQINIEDTTNYNLVDNRLDSIETKTGSLEGRLDDIEVSTSSLNSFTSSINTTIKTKLNNDNVVSGSVQVNIEDTTNYELVDDRITDLELFSSSIDTIFATDSDVTTLRGDFNSHTSSFNTITSSFDGRLDSLELKTGSIETVNTTQNGRLTSIESKTGSYITGYTETDPIFMSSPSSNITSTNITNWNTAHGWGDHSIEGYLTSHPSVSSASSSNNSGRTYIQDILLDGFGHITGITTSTETVVNTDTNYYVTGATFNNTTGLLRHTRNDGTNIDVDLLSTLSDVTVTGGTYNSGNQTLTLTKSDGNSLDVSGFAIDTDVNWYTTSATFNTSNGIITGTRNDGGTWSVDLDGRYLTGYTETDPIFTASPSAGITTTNITNWNTAYGWGNHASVGYLTSIPTHNHTSLTGVTSISFNSQSSDTSSISTTISGTGTYFDFNLTDDNNNDWWRWRFTPSGGSVYDAMVLKPVSNGNANLIISGTVTADNLNVSNWDTAYSWGDHANVGYLTSYNDYYTTGATFNTGNGIITGTRNDGGTWTVNIDGRYLTSYTETDTLDSVADRGRTTNQQLISTNPSGFRVDSGAEARIEIDSNNNWSYLRLMDNGVTSWDLATLNDGDLEFRPGGGTTGRFLIDKSGNATTNGDFNVQSGHTLRLYRSGGSAHQRGDSRLDGTDQSRLHWYGKNDTDGTANFKHAWYDGTNYINVTASSGGRVTFDGSGSEIYIGTNKVATESWVTSQNYLTSYNDYYTTGATFNTGNGIITGTRNDGGTWTVDIDGRYLTSYTETDTLASVIGRGNTTSGFISFTGTGVTSGIRFNSATVANDAFGIRVNGTSNDGELEFYSTDDDTEPFVFRHYTVGQDGTGTSVEWFRIGAGGNISTPGTITASGYNKTNWDTAHGWGNHASAGYIVVGSTIPQSAAWSGATKFKSAGDISQGAGNHSLQIYSDTNNDAFMAFHINADYAVHFGLDDSSNRLYTGGWSAGTGAKYQIWDSRDFSGTNISNWNTAYGWGNHAGLYASSSHTHSDLTTNYVGGQQTNPQTYFGRTTGLKVAMTGVPSVWADTLWINGYAGSDVKNMCALHTLRNGQPRMYISTQLSDATSYGSFYEILSQYNYNTFTPTLTGSGASGTWNISVTGNAGYASVSGNSDKLDNLDSTQFLRSDTSDTMSGVLTINHTNDNQILLTSPSSWTGIGFNDGQAGATDYIWHNGTYNTFAIGGGGSSVSGKQLHIHGGVTIGSGYSGTSVSPNGLNVEGPIQSAGTIGSNTSQSRDKIRVWNDGNYTIGFKTGFGFGHLGNSIGTTTEYAMTFQTNNQSGRGWWWGTSSDNDNQGSMGLSNEGRANIKTSLSIGEGNTTAPSTTPLYVEGSTSGSTVFEVQGTQGQLFSVTDDLTGDIFEVSDISGIPILKVNASGTVTIDGTLQVTEDVFAYYASDKNLKKNIKPIENAIDKLKLIGGYSFDWIEGKTKNTGHDVGVIAQEIEEVLPELVGLRGDGYKGVKYEKLTALLIETNKELVKRVEELEKRLK